jgi:dienelactone hydrolase
MRVACLLLGAVLATVMLSEAPAAPIPPRPPDANYTYTITAAGATIGTSVVSIEGSRAGWVVVKENASFTVSAFTAKTTTTYDAATLREVAYAAEQLPSGAKHTTVVPRPGAFNVSVPGESVDIVADPSAPLELISDNVVGSLILAPAVVHANGASAFTFARLSDGKAVVAKVIAADSPVRPARVDAKNAHLTIDVVGLRVIYWFDPTNYLVHDVEIPDQQTSFSLTGTSPLGTAIASPAPAATALPTPFAHFSSTEVRFASVGGATLTGTLTVPDRGRAPFPGVVLVHGSGPEDRDETIGPNPIFLQLSNALSNAGYAVLRYDKRGVGKSTGGANGDTREELLADVHAAFNFLRGRPEVNPKRVFLLGHSEGGELVPSVAADTNVAGIILMAPPSLPLWKISMQQVLAGVAPSARAETERQELAALDAIRHSTGVKNAWYRSSMDVDPAIDIARVRCPILILQGEGDAQVAVADVPRLADAARSANHDVTVRTFSGDNHLFEPIIGPQPQTPIAAVRQYLSVPARIDPRVLDALISWLSHQIS